MKVPIDVTVSPRIAESSGFNLGDVYYTIFRHKWKILLIFLTGLLGSVAYAFVKPPMYQSEAKILVRYIVEERATTAANDEAQMRSPDSHGENIISSEVEILSSFDLATQVAVVIGPERILRGLGGGNDRSRAARVIQKGLKVDVPARSAVIQLTFRHPDATLVQPVLNQLTDTYLKRHLEIHQGAGALDDFFLRQADKLRARLSTTEDELRKLKAEVQVISLDDGKRASMDLMARIRQELLAAEAELAEQRAILEVGSIALPVGTPTNLPPPIVSPETSEQYRRACENLDSLSRRLPELRAIYLDEHVLVRRLQQQIFDAEARKAELEVAFPSLAEHRPAAPAGDLQSVPGRIAGLSARVKELTSQLTNIQATTMRVVDAEPALTQLQRQKEVEEESLRFYSSRLERIRIGESLGAGKINNISIVETPTPPAIDLLTFLKPSLIIFLLGCFGGFGLGFVSDRILDRTIKSVADVERQGHFPLFTTVPDTSWHPGLSLPWFGRKRQKPLLTFHAPGELPNRPADRDAAAASALSLWDPQHGLRSHFEALRDRLITYSEVRGMVHKPKLVAVTSYHHGAGVTTMAAGLAAALSETGDGNVLLVDMNVEQGDAHDFYQGKLTCGLSEALENGHRDSACVQEHLYLVSARETNDKKLPRVLPKRFAHLVPRMKASDYDYIIFDMPPVTQTSVTPRLAGFMDMVLVVIESEKTGSEIVQRANRLLAESRANVGAVLNKHRDYVPKKLSQEL